MFTFLSACYEENIVLWAWRKTHINAMSFQGRTFRYCTDVWDMILHLVSLPFASSGVDIGLRNVHRRNLSVWQAAQPSKSEFLLPLFPAYSQFQEPCKICKFLVKVLPFSVTS